MRLRLLIIFCLVLRISLPAQPPASPYKLSLAVDIPLSSNALGLLGVSTLMSSNQTLPSKESLLLLNRKEVNPFDRRATYQSSKGAAYASDALLYVSIALPFLHLIQQNSRRDFGKTAAMGAEVFVANLAITNLIKETVKRKRPLLYNPDMPLAQKWKKDNFKSFFSGHTSTVASMSFFFAKTYSDYNPGSKLRPVVWSLCAALPVATGLLRYKAGKHYWTDIIAGYAVGALVGVAVPYLHSTALSINR